MTIKAALLDARGVFLRVDTLPDASHLTPSHLPAIADCDLPPGQHVWVPDAANPYGGAFWEIAWLRRIAATREDAAANRARKGRVDPTEKPGVDTSALVDFLNERGLA